MVMTEETIFVTGATRGLGRQVARTLLGSGTARCLIVTVRSEESGRRISAELNAVAGRQAVHPVLCELGDLASVRRAAEEVGRLLDEGDESGRSLPPLRAILANAGVQQYDTTTATADGFERTFGINVLGNYLLIRLLMERLVAPARLMVVSSATHFGDFAHTYGIIAPPVWTSAEELAEPRTGRAARTIRAGTAAYATSKLAQIHLVHELARRLPEGIEAYSYDPGMIPGTGLAREAPVVSRTVWKMLSPALLLLPAAVSARRSANELVTVLTARPAPAPSGSYFTRGRPARSSDASYNPQREAELWRAAAALVGLSAESVTVT